MDKIIIREATAEDAKALIEYTKIIGGESDNLTYGSEDMLITLEQEKAFLDTQYVGALHDEQTWKYINNGLKKVFGLWFYT